MTFGTHPSAELVQALRKGLHLRRHISRVLRSIEFAASNTILNERWTRRFGVQWPTYNQRWLSVPKQITFRSSV